MIRVAHVCTHDLRMRSRVAGGFESYAIGLPSIGGIDDGPRNHKAWLLHNEAVGMIDMIPQGVVTLGGPARTRFSGSVAGCDEEGLAIKRIPLENTQPPFPSLVLTGSSRAPRRDVLSTT
jgi:hypothetical protein